MGQTDGQTDWMQCFIVPIVYKCTLASRLGGTTGSASDQQSKGCGFEAY